MSDRNKGLPAGAGFTIIEVLVTMGILVILVGITMPFTINFYRRYQLDSERTTFVSLLRQARSMSMDGESGTSHGVHIASSQFTLFTGSSYDSRDAAKDQTFGRTDVVAITGSTSLVFRYLNGKASSSSYLFDDGSKTGNVYVNDEGRIDWQ